MSYMKTLQTEGRCPDCGGQLWVDPMMGEAVRCVSCTRVELSAPETRTSSETSDPGPAVRYATWRHTSEGEKFFRSLEGLVHIRLRDKRPLNVPQMWAAAQLAIGRLVPSEFQELAAQELEALYPALVGLLIRGAQP